MLYPPKKRAYEPEPKKTKDLINLPNINSKFTGSGGSNSLFTFRHFFARTQKTNVGSEGSHLWHFQSRTVVVVLMQKNCKGADPFQEVL